MAIHGLLRFKLHLTLATDSVGSGVQDVNWQAVFNHAHKHSLRFEAGDALPHGRVSASLQAKKSVSGNQVAGRVIQQAIKNDELRKTEDGYRIVCDGPSTGDIRQSLKSELFETMRNGENAVIQSPTSSGKTYTPSTTRWRNHPEITGGQPVILLSGTTDARDDALSKSRSSHATAKVLKGRGDVSPLARGDYDSDNREGNTSIKAPDGSEPSEWFKTKCDDRGLHFSVAHGIFKRAYDGDLPCCEGSDGCLASTQWEAVPRNDKEEFDYDVLHATHPFVQVPQLIENCNLIIDEQPDFTPEIATGQLRRIVGSYLKEIDAPVKTWEELIVGLTGNLDVDLENLRESLEEPDRGWFLHDNDAHTLGPGIVEALVTAEERVHDRWVGKTRYTYPTLNPNHEGPSQEVIIRIVIDGDNSNNIRLLQAIPDFGKARSVVGLDAYPAMPKWKGNTLWPIEMKRIVDSEAQHKWRRNQRNLHIVQVGNNKNTWTKQGFNTLKVSTLCNELREKYRSGFRTGIAPSKFEDNLVDILIKAGVNNPDTIHFGNEKSVEDFDSERAGIVAGCISLSSEDIKDWVALLDKEATPRREVDDEYPQGQQWVGPDANVAEELLADVRENGVLQACGRYARSPQQPDDGAIVYVLTDVLPEEYVDETIADVQTFKKKQKQILHYVASHDGVTIRDTTEDTDASKKHICSTLNRCRGHPWIRVKEEAGPYNADVFYADRCPTGLVEV